MFFKKVIAYRFTKIFDITMDDLEVALAQLKFVPVAAKQSHASFGWVPPLGKSGTMLHHNSNRRVWLTLKEQQKKIKAAPLKQALNQREAAFVAKMDKDPSPADKQLMRDETLSILLPYTLPEDKLHHLVIDLDSQMIYVDASNHKAAEDILVVLRKCLGSLPIVPIRTNTPIKTAMTNWVKECGAISGFRIGHNAIFEGMENKITLKDEYLSEETILALLEPSDMEVTVLQLAYKDLGIFMLNQELEMKCIKWSSGALERAADQKGDDEEDSLKLRFDGDMTIMCGDLNEFFLNLKANLGGFEEAPSESKNKTEEKCKTIATKLMAGEINAEQAVDAVVGDVHKQIGKILNEGVDQ